MTARSDEAIAHGGHPGRARCVDPSLFNRFGACAVRRPRACWAGLLVPAILLGAGSAGLAQSPPQMLWDMPGQPKVDPNIDPYPFDPYFAMVNHFQHALPAGWRVGQPVFQGGGFSIEIFVPTHWNGNPTSALIRACPEANSSIWREGVTRIELKPLYRRAAWAGTTCRPPTG